MFNRIRKDPYTGLDFIPKRYNQKFANRKNQIAYNNDKARKIRYEKKPFDIMLESNRKVLKKVLGGNESVIISTDFLLGSGFDFEIFNRSMNRDEVYYQCVYQFALTQLENKQYRICLLK